MSWNALRDIPMHIHISIGYGVEPTDIKLVFGFTEKEHRAWDREAIKFSHYRHVNNVYTYEQLAVLLDFQPSITNAKKNGWKGGIPDGYTEFKRGRSLFYIWKQSIELVG